MFRTVAVVLGIVFDLVLSAFFLILVMFILFVAWSAGVEIRNGAGSSTRRKT